MKLLITGGRGLLGSEFLRAARERSWAVVAPSRAEMDITDVSACVRVVGTESPDWVVHCAAFTAVDAAEEESGQAMRVNRDGSANVARAAAKAGAGMVHISTDYVFDGTLKRPYQEDDATSPQSVYGRSKLKGERAATEILGDACTIVRTSWVCGEQGNNMVKLVRRLAASGKPMSFVDDQRGCPTFTADLAPALRTLALDRPGGIFHLTNAGPVSWYAFVREILAVSGDDPHLVTPIATSELDPPRPAPRPANSVLANARWVAEGRLPLRDFRAPLAELVARL
mgnify:CR=1 FL=1